MNEIKDITRGSIWLVELENKIGSSVQSGKRPCLVVSNEKCNQYSPVITVVVLSSKMTKAKLPTHVMLGKESNLKMDSVVLCEQIMSIDIKNICYKLGECPSDKMELIDRAIKIQTSMLPLIDYSYINDKVFMIKKLRELCNMCNNQNEDLKRMFQSALLDLKRYCNDFGRSYTEFINDNNTEIAVAI